MYIIAVGNNCVSEGIHVMKIKRGQISRLNIPTEFGIRTMVTSEKQEVGKTYEIFDLSPPGGLQLLGMGNNKERGQHQ